MPQTRLASWVEVMSNIVVGFGINYTANLVVLPLFGFNVSPGAAFHIGLVFTVIALIRAYCMRRLFNWIQWGNEHE